MTATRACLGCGKEIPVDVPRGRLTLTLEGAGIPLEIHTAALCSARCIAPALQSYATERAALPESKEGAP